MNMNCNNKEVKRYFKFNMKFHTKIGSFFNYSGPSIRPSLERCNTRSRQYVKLKTHCEMWIGDG